MTEKLTYAVDEDLLAEAGQICEDLGWAHHPQECDLVSSLTYFALVKVQQHAFEEANGREPTVDELAPDQEEIKARLEPGGGFEMFTHDELHVFGHYLFMVAYLLGKSHGAVEAAASSAVINALIKEGQISRDEADQVMDGSIDPVRMQEIQALASARADKMFGGIDDDMSDFIGGLFDVFNDDDFGIDGPDFPGLSPA